MSVSDPGGRLISPPVPGDAGLAALTFRLAEGCRGSDARVEVVAASVVLIQLMSLLTGTMVLQISDQGLNGNNELLASRSVRNKLHISAEWWRPGCSTVADFHRLKSNHAGSTSLA